MIKRTLIVSSVASMVEQFNKPNIELMLAMGFEVHIACNFKSGGSITGEKAQELTRYLERLGVRYYQVDFDRNPLRLLRNGRAYRQLLNIMKRYNYAFVHCHSPVGGVYSRLAGRVTKTSIIYTAHGFHFFKGAPLINWLFFYPIESLLARYTDYLITINKEDYNLAIDKMKAKNTVYIPGVGLNVQEFKSHSVNREKKLMDLGIPNDSIVILSVGELNYNKNHQVFIKALSKLDDKRVHYIIIGRGQLENDLNKTVENLGLNNNVHLMGYREDVMDYYKASDIFVFPSRREGLGMAALEAMASGLALITSNVRGIADYSINTKTGFVCKVDDVSCFTKAVRELVSNQDLRYKMGKYNQTIVERFDISKTMKITKHIYQKYV